MQSAGHMYDSACCARDFPESAVPACMGQAIAMGTPGMVLGHATNPAPSFTHFELGSMLHAAAAWLHDRHAPILPHARQTIHQKP